MSPSAPAVLASRPAPHQRRSSRGPGLLRAAGRLALPGAAALWLALPACSCETESTACSRDGDCLDGEVCLAAGTCLPTGVARRIGADVGDECVATGGQEHGCDEGVSCRLGWCVGGGGGAGGAGGVGGAGGAGGAGGGGGGAAGSGGGPGGCADWEQDVGPLLSASCTGCHSGAQPPASLHLDSYEGALAGGVTGNEVVACQPAESLLYLKVSLETPPVGARMPFGGPYLSAAQLATIERWLSSGARLRCADPDPCVDTTPPVFAGATSAELSADGTSAQLCWSPGADDGTAADGLVYVVYEGDASGGQDFGAGPQAVSAPGATCLDRTGLTPGQEYCWVVRARDAAGNQDGNLVEWCVTTPAAACIDFATMIQPILDDRCIRCHSGAAPPAGLHLDSHAGVLAGGVTGGEVIACQPDSSLLFLKISQDVPPVGARMPADGPPYLGAAQIAAIRQWIAEGARTDCAAADPCADAIPPTFGGLTSVTAPNAASAELCWSAGSDDLTPAAELVYDAYAAAASGGQSFAGRPAATSAPGATCVLVEALSPGATTCWVVRARDAAGNHDGNVVEQCFTQPALPAGCVDHATLIQPLLDARCVGCHSGPTPPQWLRLGSYDELLAGSARRNEVIACDAAGSLLVDKLEANPTLGDRMPRGGPYLSASQLAMVRQWIDHGAERSCAEAVDCTDAAGPLFAGVTSVVAVDATTVRVCWDPATDASTPQESIRYELYEAATPGAQAFGLPAQESVTGLGCTEVRAGPASQLCFVVLARDRRGNTDANRVELCATTPAAACAVEYQELVRPILAARCTHCHEGSPAPRFLDLGSYAGIRAAGTLRDEVVACDWPASRLNLKTAPGADCGRRMPWDGPPWLAPSELSILRRWVESGARQACTEPDPCADVTAPQFAGASSLTDVDGTSVELCWAAATDDGTSGPQLVYDVYESAVPGGELFTRPSSYSVSGGATCTVIPVPSGERSCFVVRARDLRGNRDANSSELCITPAQACLEHARLVQPIFDARCVHCHSGANAPRGIQWDSFANALATGDVRGCDPDAGKLLEMVESCQMPFDTAAGQCSTVACLTPSQQRLLRAWIEEGANRSCPNGGC